MNYHKDESQTIMIEPTVATKFPTVANLKQEFNTNTNHTIDMLAQLGSPQMRYLLTSQKYHVFFNVGCPCVYISAKAKMSWFLQPQSCKRWYFTDHQFLMQCGRCCCWVRFPGTWYPSVHYCVLPKGKHSIEVHKQTEEWSCAQLKNSKVICMGDRGIPTNACWLFHHPLQ